MFTDFNDLDDNINKNTIKVINYNSIELLNFTNILKNFKENIIVIRSELIQNFSKFDISNNNHIKLNNLCHYDINLGIKLLMRSYLIEKYLKKY